ncbi:hypothetical protein KY290_033112 [Solanum tuberosum]|uniref:CCHC-type domain-containing protein n=1 Tax=Solanum tuberosum TaxID=4113 RepID=A0ABQ7U0I3_SOLTU|nr:hypothetical protein KY285_032364 [Solanum tuberosum]KAH0740069.1 hypothetical protein KY290_033112 [Solanum tuberosum]
MVPHLEAGGHTKGVVPFSSEDPFMHLCRHPRVVRYLRVFIAWVTVHNNDLWGEAIIVGFKGPHNSSRDRDFCFSCGDPDHLMRQCTSQRGRGGSQPNSSFQARPPVPQGRCRGRVQSGRGGKASSSGSAAQQSGGRVTTQAGGGRVSRPNFSSHDGTYYNPPVGKPTSNPEQQVMGLRV